MKKNYFLFIFTFTMFQSFSADYFWVGNTGNWSDLTHWASSSGGLGSAYAVVPGTGDNVFFDSNSFSSTFQTVTVDVSASMLNLDFTGITNNPNFIGAVTETITINGTLLFTPGFTHSFLGNYIFTSTTTQTITSAGQIFNLDVQFSGVGGDWTLLDPISIKGELLVQNGTFTSGGENIQAGSISTNSGVNLRTIDFSNSQIIIDGSGTCLDLRGNDLNLTVSSLAACLITFVHTADIRVEVGNEIKTIPAMTFSNCIGNVRIVTGSVPDRVNRITFGDIIVSAEGCDFFTDFNNVNSNVKTYGSITLPNNCDYIMGNPHGTGGFGGTNHTVITGVFQVGNNGDGKIRGHFVEFVQDFIGGTNTDCFFVHHTQIKGDLTIVSTGGADIDFNRKLELTGNLNCNGDGDFRFDEISNLAGNINLGTNSNVFFRSNGTAAIINLVGDLTVGSGTYLNLGNTNVGIYNLPNLILNQNATLDINSSTSITNIGNLSLNGSNIVKFNTNASTTITGVLVSNGSCSARMLLKSITSGTAANITFSIDPTSDYTNCQDLNCTTPTTFTNNNGEDLSNNTGITFTSASAGIDYFWVGATTGNTKLGVNSTGVNNNWSNPSNWSTTTGLPDPLNQCIPGVRDDVFFDVNSFTAGANTVDLDAIIQNCNKMTWSDIPTGTTIDALSTTTVRVLKIYGDLILHSEVDNQFEGTVSFSAHDATQRQITSAGSKFFGNVEFNYIGGDWILLDDITMIGNARADVTFLNGTVDASDKNWNIEDDWKVTNGTFTANTSTVVFNGRNSQNSNQDVTPNGNSFYNILIQRQANGGAARNLVRLQGEVTIDNDLDITKGGLNDNGFQITGSLTGNMSLSNNARLILGKSGISTLFPTNYMTANINLNDRGHTRYQSNIAQIISSVPIYGRLYLTNTSGGLKDKTIDGPVTINDLLFIDDFNHLIDAGFQITTILPNQNIRMDPNSKLTLGTATSATQFPLNYTNYDINEPSLIVYNSGINQMIKSLSSGTNDRNYSNLTISDAAGAGTTTKTLLGDIIVRGDLTIDAGNELDANPANFDVEIEGDWLNSGLFTPQNGTVQFTNTATVQNIISGGTSERFYDLEVNNTSGAGLIIEDDITIENTLTLTEGIINEGAGGNEVVRFLNGSTLPIPASDLSHVDGRVEKVTETGVQFNFPVGKNGIYRPITVTPTADNAEFRAEYFQIDPDPSFDHNSIAATLNHISSCEYWVLDRTVPGANADVKLSWDSRTSCGVTMQSELRVARWDGAIWQDQGNGGTTGLTGAGTIVSSGSVINFSPFTLASISGGNPLPVDLLYFSASSNINRIVDLNWRTVSETDNDYFTIERSINGVLFEKVTEVNGAGNSSLIIDYKSVDDTPYLGVSYYRLKQTDFNGNISYSNSKKVSLEVETFSIYPNPSKLGKQITIESSSSVSDYSIEIYSMIGKLISSTHYSSNLNQLPLDNLASGNYLIVLKTGTLIQTKKLVIE